jgi:hypothetical protein
MENILSADSIVSTTAAVIALVFAYFPVLRVKFAGLSSEAKSGTMIGLMLLVSVAVWGMGCAGWFQSGIDCSQAGLMELGKLFLLALVTNQGVNRVSPELADVSEAKKKRSQLR